MFDLSSIKSSPNRDFETALAARGELTQLIDCPMTADRYQYDRSGGVDSIVYEVNYLFLNILIIVKFIN